MNLQEIGFIFQLSLCTSSGMSSLSKGWQEVSWMPHVPHALDFYLCVLFPAYLCALPPASLLLLQCCWSSLSRQLWTPVSGFYCLPSLSTAQIWLMESLVYMTEVKELRDKSVSRHPTNFRWKIWAVGWLIYKRLGILVNGEMLDFGNRYCQILA